MKTLCCGLFGSAGARAVSGRARPWAGGEAGGLAETGTPGFWRKRNCGKGKYLISGHVPLMYYLLFANICVFVLYLSQRKGVSVPRLKPVFGSACAEVPPAANPQHPATDPISCDSS